MAVVPRLRLLRISGQRLQSERVQLKAEWTSRRGIHVDRPSAYAATASAFTNLHTFVLNFKDAKSKSRQVTYTVKSLTTATPTAAPARQSSFSSGWVSRPGSPGTSPGLTAFEDRNATLNTITSVL